MKGGGRSSGHGNGDGDGDASLETILDVVDDDSTAVPKISSPSALAQLTAEQPPVKLKSALSRFKGLVSVPKRFSSTGRSSRTKSVKVHALKGFKFITASQRTSGWRKVEDQFDQLNADGLLHCSKFGECIGNGHYKNPRMSKHNTKIFLCRVYESEHDTHDNTIKLKLFF